MPEVKTLAQRATDVRGLLERHKAQIALALPRHLPVDRLIRVALTAIQQTPKLLEADQRSLYAAVMMAAQLGLEPDGALGQAYLVPFENRKKRRVEVQFMPGYRGLLALVRRSGQLSTVQVRAVHARDQFRYRFGLDEVLEHTPYDPGDQADPTLYDDQAAYLAAVDAGPLIAVYAVAKLRDGGVQWDVMRRHEVNLVRERSRAKDDGPWVTDYEAMAQKTILKRLTKLLPMSVEAARAVDLDDRGEIGLPQDLDLHLPPGAVVDDVDPPPAGGSALSQLTQTLTQGKAGERPAASPADSQGTPGDEVGQ